MDTLLLILPTLFLGGILISVFLRNNRASCAVVNAVISFASMLVVLVVGIPLFADTAVPQVHVFNELRDYGSFAFGLDPLSALFVMIYLATAGIFALSEIRKSRGGIMNSSQWAAFGFLSFSVTGVLFSRDMMSFLILWEFVTATTAVLLLFRNRERMRARTAWLYLFFSHLSMVILVAVFALIEVHTGHRTFAEALLLIQGFDPALLSGLFFLILIAFGARCGLFPFYFWIAPASSYPPVPVSGLLLSSGFNLGLYGLLRFSYPFLKTAEIWWGPLLLVFGILTIISGAFSAVIQNDIKQQSGYAAVVHIGMVLSGFGLVFTAAYYHYPNEAVLILCGILLLIINLSTVQPALLLAAQAAGKANGSFDINRGGGLARQYPGAGFLYAMGSISICMLPPFAGFLAPMLILLAVVRLLVAPGLPSLFLFVLILTATVFSAVSVVLSLTFLKSFGLFFLGRPRTPETVSRPAIEPMVNVSLYILFGILLLLTLLMPLCLYFLPAVLAPITAVEPATLRESLRLFAFEPVRYLWGCSLFLWTIALLIRVTLRISILFRRNPKHHAAPPWNGGFLPPSPRADYSAYSFTKPFIDMMPKIIADTKADSNAENPIPQKIQFEASHDITIQTWLFVTVPQALNHLALRIQSIEVGRIHFYLSAMIITLLIILGIKYL